KRSHDIVKWTVGRLGEAQAALDKELRALKDPAALSPDLIARINQVRQGGGAWWFAPEGEGDAAALVVPKKDFSRFIDQIFAGVLRHEPSTRSLAALRSQLLENPYGLTQLIPGSQLVDFGDADGFYIVYQSQFSVPHGLETSNWVTLGNLAKLWGNNISVTGYQFASPPNPENAPYGDKGVEVQVESLQGANWVNYLNVDFHRFIQDIPPDTKMASSARQSRLMVFDDFAMLLFGDRLYVAAAGFGDFAMEDTWNKPHYYGGSFKTSLKFNEVMRLNAEQQVVFAKDPRTFLQTVNLDFTGLDPDLNRDFVIDAKGEKKYYKRTQIGPSFDIARLLESQSGDAFTVDLFFARQEGTDDPTQNSAGISVLKGFSIKDESGKPWMIINNRAGAEAGEKMNVLSDRVSVTLPDWGVAFSAEGRLIGDAKTYFLEASKTLGPHSNLSVSYGSRYPGMPDRLTIAANTSFTLGQLWRFVSEGAADSLTGSEALKSYHKDLDAFFTARKDDKAVQELKAVYMRDVGRKLITQDIGTLYREIAELRRAGAFMDNVRQRGMVGFVTNPIGDAIADRAVGGGFTAGTQTEMTLTKTQKALIEAKAEKLYREGLRLQERMLELTREWQEVLVEAAQAQWELKMARAASARAPTQSLRLEGAAWEAQALARLNSAVIRYNMLSGRSPSEPLPFEGLDGLVLT
ncbi:MAG: hypothetical protein AAB339_03810, partial [Elusimicrobiota bacterium]